MQPLSLLRALKRDAVDYVRSKYPFLQNDRTDLDEQLRTLLEKTGTIFQDPVLQIGRSRKTPEFSANIFTAPIRSSAEALRELKSPYAHQVRAWKQIMGGTPTVVSTGTGSGKSESFIIPVLDGLVRQGFGPERRDIGALFIYPMNALVQDQFIRIFKYAAGSGLRVGIYNGAYRQLPDSERKKICDRLAAEFNKLKADRPELDLGYDLPTAETLVVDPNRPETFPHILLTNYKMLEYMLLQNRDQPLVERMDLQYLALDEAHTYTGTLALEISCLLARLRVHLGEKRSNYLPVATSATLSSGKDGSSNLESELSTFFSKLFGKPFPETGFVVGEEYEDLPSPTVDSLAPFLSASSASLKAALAQPFPASMFELAAILFGVRETDLKKLSAEMYRRLQSAAKPLSSLLLYNDDSRDFDSALRWSEALRRFTDRSGGSASHLEALLMLLSHAFVDERLPLLGLRVHTFARSEPKLLWTLDSRNVGDEASLRELAVPALSFVSCKKCGHMAYGAEAIRSSGVEEILDLRPLSDFRDEVKEGAESETVFFHAHSGLTNDDTDALGRDWELIPYSITRVDGRLKAKPLGKGHSEKSFFYRVRRTSRQENKRVLAPEGHSCPRCATTSQESPVIVTHRGGASTDLSVYAASNLTNIADPQEQRLLIFSDNRQETSFLAGFLTDRHRKINLRRCLAGYLQECKQSYGTTNIPVLRNYKRDERHNPPQVFDLAVRLVWSLESGQAISPSADLPKSLKVRKLTLQNLIPRSVLDKPRRGRDTDWVTSIKQWLLENYRLTGGQENGMQMREEEIDLFEDSARGEWILKLLTHLLILDLSAGHFGEGSLPALGISCLYNSSLDPARFEELAKNRPEFRLGARGLFACAKWLVDELLYVGQWADLDPTGHTRVAMLRSYESAVALRFQGDRKTSNLLLGQGVDSEEGLSRNSRLAKILLNFAEGDEQKELLKTWANKSTWDAFINTAPLRDILFYSDEGRDLPKLAVYGNNWFVTTEVGNYRGKLSHSEYCAVPSSVDIGGLPTGKRVQDTWEKIELSGFDYYSRLLSTPLKEQSKLVRAREHNGMLSAADANEAVLKFENGLINTLVATPTLEMGVDLPDLPTVIHRSVPPSASNYAQRSGRAGRGPKRALVLAYCGLGSHDMTFFEEPEAMVLGEILPPGIPDKNSFIIKRHINGLILESLSIRNDKFGPPLQLRFWTDFVDTRDLQNRLIGLSKNSQFPPDFSQSTLKCSWTEILNQRAEIMNQFVSAFVGELSRGLWAKLPKEDLPLVEQLKRDLLTHASEFSDHFRKQIDAYRNLINSYLLAMEPFQAIPTPDENSDYRRAKRFSELYLGVSRSPDRFKELPMPLNDLAASGFLPNFDFPGQVIRFKGLKDELGPAAAAHQQEDRMLQYDRGGTVALREFAPGQKVYGHGFIYDVDRFLENDLTDNLARGYGVCGEGCTTLTPPESDHCLECGSEVLRIETQKNKTLETPQIVQIREVHGKQDSAISDRSNFRERHYFAEEARRIGAPHPDQAYQHESEESVSIQLHLTKSHYLKTVFMVLNTRNYREGSTSQKVFYRKHGYGSLFEVRLKAPQGEQGWEPFIPSIQIEGQGIVFNFPFLAAHRAALISDGDPERLRSFQVTLCNLIKRAAQRVLRLGPRSGQFELQVHRIMVREDEKYRERSSSFVMLDREPGGSGVIPLIWDSWDEVLDRVRDLVQKDCCDSSCYRCLRSFDNQADHALLDKSLFRSETGVPLIEFLRRNQFKQSSVSRGADKKVDERSPAEEAFKAYVLKELPKWSLDTQVNRMKQSGGLLSIPDFELIDNVTQKKITAFIDGFEYHGTPKNLYGDLRKRNELASRGYRVVAIPASKVLRVDLSYMSLLFSNHDEAHKPFPTIEGYELPEGVIPSLEPKVSQELLEVGYKGEIKPINTNAGLEKLKSRGSSALALFIEAYEKLPKSLRPIGIIGDDRILFRVSADEVLQTKEIWSYFWIYYSGLNVLGYRPIAIWCGRVPD